MKNAWKKLVIGLLTLCSFSLLAKGNNAAKAIIVKGTVNALVDGQSQIVKRGDWLPEGAEILTEAKSFTKLLFIDKSTMNVGPNSQMKIESFPKEEAGIINLVKGQVRSKVTKNYMDIKDKDKSKLFIKTKTAAMGVRGTDFQVSFNPINEATSLVTFEGAVAMAKLEGLAQQVGGPPQRALESVVSGKAAVVVRRGQYSGANPQMKRATLPVKISPVQLESLQKNETPGMAAEAEAGGGQAEVKPKKKFRSVVPPGVDSKAVANNTSSVDKVMADTVGQGTVQAVEKEVVAEVAGTDAGAPPPEGAVDLATGAVAPTAGGFVDLGTAQYIPPPKGSTFDANAGVFVPPPEVGGVDPATGDYKNDHYTLNPDGTFSEKAPEPTQDTAAAPAGPSRTVASTKDGGSAPKGDTTAGAPAPGPKGEAPPASAPPPPPPEVTLIPTMEINVDTSVIESAVSTGGSLKPMAQTDPNGGGREPASATTAPDGPKGDDIGLPEGDILDIADQTLQDNQQQINDFNNSDNNLIFNPDARTRVNFDLNVTQ